MLQILSAWSVCVLLLAFTPANYAFSRGFSGKNAAFKYCGEVGDSCMFNNECCQGFTCNFNDNYDGQCSPLSGGNSKNAVDSTADKAVGCSSNMDCPADQCCKLEQGGAKGILKHICSANCASEVAAKSANNPFVGNYQGQNFWSRWQRSQLHR